MFDNVRNAARLAAASVLLLSVATGAQARTSGGHRPSHRVPFLKVLPWNGHRAAVTLTFDDGSPSGVRDAVPVLDQKKVKATFFVTVVNAEEDEAAWAQAGREGHELANHTVHHCHAADLGTGQCLSAEEEIDGCNQYIVSRLGAPGVYTFAYPFVDTSPKYVAAATNRFFLARAGDGHTIGSAGAMDWLRMDAKFIAPSAGETVRDWTGWVDSAASHSKWLVLVFHSIQPEQWFEPISRSDLATIVDRAKARNDVWIDTFANVGAYLRGAELFESVHPVESGGSVVWQWALPAHFPPGKSLRVETEGGVLSQGGVPLVRDALGAYTVSLDAGRLVWQPTPHRVLTASVADRRPKAH